MAKIEVINKYPNGNPAMVDGVKILNNECAVVDAKYVSKFLAPKKLADKPSAEVKAEPEAVAVPAAKKVTKNKSKKK